ncbi:MAG: TIGR01906 family membrane protein [Chloroflexota bacterium]|nr:TIGR01906 family membrane protein [Chloroflexota bacterium]
MDSVDESQLAAKPLDNDPAPDQNTNAAAGRQRETHMGFARMLATLIFVVALPVALLSTNVRLLANAPLVYDYAFDRYNAEDATGLSRADLDSTAGALRQYFNNSETTFFHTVTEGGLPEPVFNARETRHMEDVKRLFVWVNRVQELSVVFVVAYVISFFVWSREGNVRELAQQSLIGLGIGALGVGGIAIFAAFGFDSAFTRFHEVLFSNDFWQLDPRTDHLIQVFPEPFWQDMAILLGLISAAEGFLIAGASAVYLLGTKSERRHLAASVDVKTSTTQAA